MTLDEAIKHCLEVAERQEIFADDKEMYSEMLGEDYKGFEEGCRQCAADHRQLAEWLTELKVLKALVAGYNPADIQTLEMLLAMMRSQNNNDTNLCELFDKEVELKEAKRLLKAAVDDFDCIYRKLGDNCEPMPDCDECLYIPTKGCYCKWRYADEAKKLIKG